MTALWRWWHARHGQVILRRIGSGRPYLACPCGAWRWFR